MPNFGAIDVGSSSVRMSVYDQELRRIYFRSSNFQSAPDGLGTAEFDAEELYEKTLDLIKDAISQVGKIAGIGLANQRATCLIWSKSSGKPISKAIGWQDLRTVGICLEKQQEGIKMLPNASISKLVYLLDYYSETNTEDILFGTLDSYLVFRLTNGLNHVSDTTNVGATGMMALDGKSYDYSLLERLKIPVEILPQIIPSFSVAGSTKIEGNEIILGAILGDQQGSLLGQSAISSHVTKATFGTGAMVDQFTGAAPPASFESPNGTFPIVCFSQPNDIYFGNEALMISCASALDWANKTFNLFDNFDSFEQVLGNTPSSNGVYFVPALFGLGTPYWDFGARATLIGLTRATNKSYILRALVEGIAQRAKDLIIALEKESNKKILEVRVDGGLSQSPGFCQILADALQIKVAQAKDPQATSLGACYGLLLTLGEIDLSTVEEKYESRAVFEPENTLDRDGWLEALYLSKNTIPELSALSF